MNKYIFTVLIAVLLVFKIDNIYAADANIKLKSLPVLERQVIKIIPIIPEDVFVSVPSTALIKRHGIPGVFVVEKNQARFRMVRIGNMAEGQVEILSGLFGNEIVLAAELEQVHDGSPIMMLTK